MAVRVRKSAASPAGHPPPAVVITGSRLRNKYYVVLFGRTLRLTYRTFDVFIELLLARRNPLSNGYAPSSEEGINRVGICRLRKRIASWFGDEVAKDFVQTGSRAEYRINPSVANAHIVLDASVPELVALHVLSAEELADLQSIYRTLPDRWPVDDATVPAAEFCATTPSPTGVVRLTRPRAQTTTTPHLAALA